MFSKQRIIGRKGGVASLLALLFLFLSGLSAAAGVVDPELDRSIQSAGYGEEIPVIIKLSDKPDLRPFKGLKKQIARSAVTKALRGLADRSQGDVRSHLERRGAKVISSLWLVNGMAATVRANEIRALASLPGVESVRPDAVVFAPGTATATQAVAPEWNLNAIRAPELWNMGYRGAGVVIASMDTGVDADHPDLKSSWRGGGNSWYDPNGQHLSPYDFSGHGTQVMGIMAGGSTGGSAIGVAPEARWISVKIFDDSGRSTYSTIHKGFQWLLDPDGNPDTDDAPDIVNNSWGLDNVNNCSPEFRPDIQNLQAAGIDVVFAGGNYGPGAGTSVSPGNNPEAYAVGAVDGSYTVASFSSRGASACDNTVYPELVAPGVGIRTSDLTFGGAVPDAYMTVTGTSFSTPHVAGSMALLLSAFPDLAVSDLDAALTDSAQDLGPQGAENSYGYGMVDVMNAYNLLLSRSQNITVDPPVYDFVVSAIGSSSQKGFVLQNTGQRGLVIQGAVLSGTNPQDFSVLGDSCSGITLPSMGRCSIDIAFSPKAAGLREAQLNIRSNDPDSPLFTVLLTGTGKQDDSLTVTSPNGGESWRAGRLHKISWSYAGNAGSHVRILLFKKGKLYRTIAHRASIGTNGSGSFSWRVPLLISPGNDYTIRITTDRGIRAKSDKSFTIRRLLPLRLSLPTAIDLSLFQ
ncbi:MAG: S8 family serine peptidase [Thermodesulfovibrionales bacterium]